MEEDYADDTDIDCEVIDERRELEETLKNCSYDYDF